MSSSRRAAQLGLCLVCLVLSLGIGVLLSQSHGMSTGKASRFGQVVPDAALYDLDGSLVRIHSFAGKVTVLYFNANNPRIPDTCRLTLNLLCEEFKDHSRVAIAAVRQASDAAGPDGLRELRVRSAVLGHAFRTLVDTHHDVSKQYGVQTTSAFLILDEQTRLVYRINMTDSDASPQEVARRLQQGVEKTLTSALDSVASK